MGGTLARPRQMRTAAVLAVLSLAGPAITGQETRSSCADGDAGCEDGSRITAGPIPRGPDGDPDFQGRWLRSIVQGYYNYFGVPGNSKSLNTFRTLICRAWFRALRRRSHKAVKLKWLKMQWLIKYFIPSVKVTHPYPNQRLRV